MQKLILFSITAAALVINAAGQQAGNATSDLPSTTANQARSKNSTDSDFLGGLNLREMAKSWTLGAQTNGLICALSFNPLENRDTLPHLKPILHVHLVNATTNDAYGFVNLPIEVLHKIKMVDSKGVEVKRTAAGEDFRDWTAKQMIDWFEEQVQARWSGRWIVVPPLDYIQTGDFSLPELFRFDRPGEYTVRVRIPLIKIARDSSNKAYLTTNCIPEVVAKVQISLADIQAAASNPDSQAKPSQSNSDVRH